MERAAYRIIDANFNRAREAIRVIEDFCRFVLNCRPLAARAKQLRHDLSALIAKLDPQKLITSRDTLADVGTTTTVTGALKRTDLTGALTAAARRLTEALRVLAETIQPIDSDTAGRVEQIRYHVYTLEKDVKLFGSALEKFSRVRLYVIISSSLPAEVISLAQRCAAAGADCIQMRAKQLNDDTCFATAVEFVGICRDAGVLSVINDRPDIAIAAGADGVHLGQHDLPADQVRKLQLAPLIIGKSTHSPAQLRTACEQLPTYVSLGPVFATPTKPTAEPVGLDYVRYAVQTLADTGIAHVAIGGITLDNVADVLKAGAAAIAVCSAVTTAGDPASACRAFRKRIEPLRTP